MTRPLEVPLDSAGCVLIDDYPPCGEAARSLLFADPIEVVSGSIEDVFPEIERAKAKGYWAAGLLTYDGGLSLDRPFQSRHRPWMPGAWFGIYRSPRVGVRPAASGETSPLGARTLNVCKAEYLAAFQRAKAYIEAGDVYQVNLTAKMRFENPHGARALFSRLRAAHPVGHSAFVDAGDWQVASLSPELFLRRSGSHIVVRPMKGTAKRGLTAEADDLAASAPAADPKNRAENLMIVDLLRNDLGRVCVPGSIEVPALFQVERYRSLLQMTSDVRGELRPGTTDTELIRASFPPGSVTGAPKLRAMEIIDELEAEGRGAYCGAIGFFGPDGEAVLNVAIRTVVQRGTQCEMGIGSGVVADSDPEGEWREVLLKGEFLDLTPWEYDVLETAFASRDGLRSLPEHLARMEATCRRLGLPFDARRVERRLVSELAGRTDSGPWRTRILVDGAGVERTEWHPYTPWPQRPLRVRLASMRVDSAALMRRHKTTDREDLDREFAAARADGYDEVLFTNERDEATEGAVSNVFAFIGGRWATPSLECGLLSGIWRAEQIRELEAEERPISAAELLTADLMHMGNSVRGGRAVGELRDGRGRVVWSDKGGPQ